MDEYQIIKTAHQQLEQITAELAHISRNPTTRNQIAKLKAQKALVKRTIDFVDERNKSINPDDCGLSRGDTANGKDTNTIQF